MTPMLRRGAEVLAYVIGCEERHTARPAVHVRGLERLTKVFSCGHVRDRVVHEHAVEFAPQPDRPQVTLDVVALPVERPAYSQHPGRGVDQRQPKVPLQMGRVVATPTAQLEDGGDLDLGR